MKAFPLIPQQRWVTVNGICYLFGKLGWAFLAQDLNDLLNKQFGIFHMANFFMDGNFS